MCGHNCVFLLCTRTHERDGQGGRVEKKRERERERDRETERQRQTDRQTDRQTHRQRETDI